MNSKSCGLCGQRFANVFEAVDHTRRTGSENNFDPKFILGARERMNLGTFLKQVYDLSYDKSVRDKVETAFSLLYIAEMRPKTFPALYKSFVEGKFEDATQFVYLIVTQEAFKEVGLYDNRS